METDADGALESTGVREPAPTRLRAARRRLPGPRTRTVLLGLVVLAIAGTGVFYLGVPHWRPGLQAGERYGIDVSNHQGAIDWKQVAGDDISFAYIKATEGKDFTDKRFAENWKGAGDAGIRRGAYHFFTLCSPGAAQAANFLKALPDDRNALPPAVDLEYSACPRRPAAADFEKQLRAFVQAVEAKVGQPVLIYSLPVYEQSYPADKTVDRERWERRQFRRPAPDGPQGGWRVWQASARAWIDGIDGFVDLDVLRS
jgi:lysozyme